MERPDERQPRARARPTDAVLVAAARGGERWAKEALFRRHAPMALGLARRLLASDAELEDVVQEAAFRALTHLHKLRDADAFGSWFSGIVIRRVRTVLRHRSFLSRIGLRAAVAIDPDSALAPSCPPDIAAELARIHEALNALPAQARLVLLLSRIEGYSLVEIADMLEISVSTVKRRLNDAERALAAFQGDGR